MKSLKVLRLPAVLSKTGLGRSSIYARLATGDFPAPIKLGVRSIGWNEADIDEWITSRIEASFQTRPAA